MTDLIFNTTRGVGVIFGGSVTTMPLLVRGSDKRVTPTPAGNAEGGVGASGPLLVVAAAVSVAVAVSPAGILPFERPLPEEVVEPGESGQE